MENKIEIIPLELTQNMKDFISEQVRLQNEFRDYTTKILGISKEQLGKPQCVYPDYQKKLN